MEAVCRFEGVDSSVKLSEVYTNVTFDAE